jgi:hypothetical protein
MIGSFESFFNLICYLPEQVLSNLCHKQVAFNSSF